MSAPPSCSISSALSSSDVIVTSRGVNNSSRALALEVVLCAAPVGPVSAAAAGNDDDDDDDDDSDNGGRGTS